MKRRLILALLIVTFPGMLPAQGDERGSSALRDIVSFYAPLVVPKLFQDTARLRALIRDEEFASFRALRGDLMAVDAIYEAALEITWGNRYEALLICTFAVMEHRRVGVRLPVIGPLLWFPLTSEFEVEFADRVRNLPTRLYPDTPAGGEGDRDKLQHFFGSALLALVSESREAAERLGNFVEEGEEQFIVGGRYDERDRRANQQGRSFGLALLAGFRVVPSDFLQLSTAFWQERPVIGPEPCVPVQEEPVWEKR